MQRLALFDIDCTLIDAHGAGGRAILRAINDVYGVEGELGDYSFHGRTDPGIVRDLADLWGAGDPDAAGGFMAGETQPQAVRELAGRLGTPDEVIDAGLTACLERYVELLAGEVAEGHVEVLPGIRELVTALAADERVLVGLVTGQRGGGRAHQARAHRPLSAVRGRRLRLRLRPTVPTCRRSPSSRAERLRNGASKARRSSSSATRPADIECGAGLGVKAIAVATGRHTVDELAAHAPDHVFADFSDWRAALEAILA